MNALRLSLRYGCGDLSWADRQSHEDLIDVLALDVLDGQEQRPPAPALDREALLRRARGR